MPILMRVNELEPGMVLARNIMNMYSVLLPHGRHLTESDIDGLKKRFAEIAVPIFDPLLDDATEFDDESQDHAVSLKVRKNIASMTHKVSTMVRSGVSIKKEQLEGMETVVNDMMGYLASNPVTMAVIEQSANWDEYIREHSANVFYLSLLIGNTIKNYIKKERERLSAAKTLRNAMDITPLATAAMFHDIAMSSIECLYQSDKPLTDEDKDTIFQHPTIGADMLPEQTNPMVKLIIRNHHENFLGTGYPNRLDGTKINIFAKILRVADAYSSAIATGTYPNAQPSINVLYDMLYGRYAHYYDPVILKVFASIIQPFPIGAKIQLSNGHCAVVVKHNSEDCFNPRVIVAFDEFGDPLTREQLQPPYPLRSDNNALPVKFSDIDLSFINNMPAEATPGVTITADDNTSENDTDAPVSPREYNTILDFEYP